MTRPIRHRIAVIAALAAAGAAAVQCAGAPPPPAETTSSPAAPPPSTAAPVQIGATVDAVTAADLGASWHPGCPVGPDRLRRVVLDHLGFDGRTHRGQLIVHQDVVAQVIAIFADLYRLGYPIEKIRTVDHYPGADDELSMEDDNTSAFSCRTIPGSGHWALHAYGRAVDINPLRNPYIDHTGAFQPKNAAQYLDRGRTDPGMLHDGDAAVRAFTDRGWSWGGHWHSPIDYQHFERRCDTAHGGCT